MMLYQWKLVTQYQANITQYNLSLVSKQVIEEIMCGIQI